MNKYENALIEILNGLGNNYDLYTIEVKECVGYRTKYMLCIYTFDDDRTIEVSKEAYEVLVELNKQIKDKEEE